MNLYIHFPTNLELFRLFAENRDYIFWWNSNSEKDVMKFFSEFYKGELIEKLSTQYMVNIKTLKQLKAIKNNCFNDISWIYYWSDNCEFLTPTIQELNEALELFYKTKKEYKYQKAEFILVTPYCSNNSIQKVKDLLDELNERWKKSNKTFEVVINDFWLIKYKKDKELNNIKFIFWRYLHKLIKRQSYSLNNTLLPWEIKNKTNSQEQIEYKEKSIKNQIEFYSDCPVTSVFYQNFLKRNEVERVALDYIEKREDLYKKNFWSFGIDLYYPWSILITWRLCDTSWIEQVKRKYHALDIWCPRLCQKYDLFYTIDKSDWIDKNPVQRWNTWWMENSDLSYLNNEFLNNKNNRIIFEPFIPV